MFSKNKPIDPAPKPAGDTEKAQAEPRSPALSMPAPASHAPAPKAPASVLSSDLTVIGGLHVLQRLFFLC